jgi:hypothetical protein
VIIQLNPDIFHTIIDLRKKMSLIKKGKTPEDISLEDIQELKKVQSGESEISFLKDVDSREGFQFNRKRIFLYPRIIISNGWKQKHFSRN